jgi:ornithine cyclodeaminase
VFVEYEPQTRIEGDLQQMAADFAVTELWQVLQGHQRGRTDEQQVTVFDSVGFALEDFSALRYMRDCAQRLGVGQDLALIPRFADPKDLFGLIGPLTADAGNMQPPASVAQGAPAAARREPELA